MLKPKRISLWNSIFFRFLEEPANERVVEEDSEQDDDDDGHDQEEQPQHDSGASRLDMLLHSQPSGPVAVSSPAKRVSFQQQHSSVQVQHQSDISSRATTTTTTESKLFASSQRQVSFREPSPQSFNNEEGTASGDDREDTDNQTDADTDTPAHQTTEREWDRDRGRTPEDRGGRIPEDPNAFITEAESLLNAASMGISQMEIKTSIGGEYYFVLFCWTWPSGSNDEYWTLNLAGAKGFVILPSYSLAQKL